MLFAGRTNVLPPNIDLSQLHPLLAVHDVTFDAVQERVTSFALLYTDVDDAVNVTLGTFGFATFTVTLCDVEPPGPVQLRVYVLVAVRLSSMIVRFVVR